MAWSMEGQLFETCNCEILCPCSAYPFAGADYDRCLTVYGFRIDSGRIEGVDIPGKIVAVAFVDFLAAFTDPHSRSVPSQRSLFWSPCAANEIRSLSRSL